jgi:hypothetical protein
MNRLTRIPTVAFLFTMTLAAPSAYRTAQLRPPVPMEPIVGIIDAFRTYSIVGVNTGQESGDARGRAFLLSLIRDPRFTKVVNDLVMEGYSARYQDLSDRFVRGEDVPNATLRGLWQDTTQVIAIADEPHVEFFRAVRGINATLSAERQLRVLAADPPIDWSRVQTPADFRTWLEQRDTFPAELTRREVIGKHRRALAVWGGGHLQRRNQASNYQMDEPLTATFVSLLEAAGTKVFIVRGGPIEEEAVRASWPMPSLALVQGTTVGAADEPSGGQRFSVRNGQLTPIPREQWVRVRVEDQQEAVLWLGPASTRTTTPLSPALCDAEFLETRSRRRALAGLPSETDRLRQFCASLTPK